MPINQFSNVTYSWVPAGVSRPNTFTAQNIFKAASTTVPAFVAQGTGTISGTVPTLDANGIALFQGTEAVAGHVFFSASGSTTHVVFRRNNGTYASPTALASGDVIGSLQWQGRGASTFGTVPCAQIRGVTTQAFTEAARGTALEFYVTANGSITQQQTFVVDPALVYSLVALQGSGAVRVSSTAGNTRTFALTTSAVNRWGLIANSTAEGGSNAGSDFEIRRYSDAGADLGLVVRVTRSTGVVDLLTRCYFQGARTDITSTVNIIDSTGTNRSLRFTDGNVANRWALIANSTAESGSNAGSDFEIRRYSDAGADLGLAMAVTRSTGNITFNGGGGITTFSANKIQITTAQTPATSAAAGNAGDIAWDDTYLYVRMSTGWRRIALGAAF